MARIVESTCRDPNDFVVLEIETALRLNKLVIPVLVGEARFPSAESLPDEIRPLAYRNAVELLPKRFANDCKWLIQEITDALSKHKKDSKKVIRIHLGIENSRVAFVKRVSPEIIENSEGMPYTPSILAFNSDGERLIGLAAKRQAVANPKNTLFAIKRLVGRRYEDPLVEKDKKLVPYQIVKADNGDAWVSAHGNKYRDLSLHSSIGLSESFASLWTLQSTPAATWKARRP